MPFNHDSKGLILTPSKIIETEFYLDRRFEMNSKIKIDNFSKKENHILNPLRMQSIKLILQI